jgi:hypothetical protein
MTLLQHVETAWREAGLNLPIRSERPARIAARVDRSHRDLAFTLALRALEKSGCRTCVERDSNVWSIYAFSEADSICLDLSDGKRRRRRRLFGKSVPRVALLGPDGVGKSTVLKLAREWFEREAGFVDITLRQWRPGLLPPLAALLGKGREGEGDSDQRPRRHRGNLQWIRLFYYFLDFLFGAFKKDRNRGDSSRMVVYDRCALDMCVDPYRFGLSSGRGTRLLWKLTPRPKTLILLYDEPERIAHRKDDLQVHEVAEQLDTWLKLAEQDEVHAIVRVDDTPQEIAKRVRDLLIDAFVRHVGQVGNLRPIGGALWARPAGVLDAPAGSGEVPREYAILPSAKNPRFLIPLTNRRAAAASMAIYNAQRPIARLVKSLLTWGLRTGLAQPFLRHRVKLPNDTLRELAGPAVGYDDVSIAVSLGTPGPNQKPALQIMDRDGRVLGFSKIGWNSQTIASIRNEEEALRRLEKERFQTAVVPYVLHAGEFSADGNYILVQSTATELRPGSGIEPDNRHVQFLADLHRLKPAIGQLPYPGLDDVAEIKRSGLHYYAHLMEWAREYCAAYTRVPLGPGHGDFTPWNIRAAADGKILVFDWETFETRVPACWDLFHLLVAGEVEVRGTKPGAIYTVISRPGPVRELIEDYFRRIDADSDFIEPLFVSYLAHSLCFGLIELADEASAKDRLLQRTWAALLTLARHCGRSEARDGVAEPAPETVAEAV